MIVRELIWRPSAELLERGNCPVGDVDDCLSHAILSSCCPVYLFCFFTSDASAPVSSIVALRSRTIRRMSSAVKFN